MDIVAQEKKNNKRYLESTEKNIILPPGSQKIRPKSIF